ncbi:hypothetical protein L228DRAFT_158542 [Xylona heveae TC161]|uniref:Uncharacterized protein n=1 Tax=Xylona heveae (strain CBS 132557 / TC161) TaxID=1328760 RepID=A0A165G494_XYLHT|nr:hypothetical protein L228DRAFT_158542 [Xylona heveae TC161]KZF21720.1 hypothetical protein L228DRAFT_158542 [Xylona heveae TC161]
MPEAVKSKAAFVEDYNSDDEETLPGTRTVANVGARMRDNLKPTKPKESPTPASDSGYSSHTAATVGSADFTKQKVNQSSTSNSPVKKQRPALVQALVSGSHRTSDKQAQRTSSRSEPRTAEECSCDECMKSERATSTPLERRWDVEYAPFSTRPTIHYPTDTSQSHPAQHPAFNEGPIIHSANPRQRAASSNSYGRPASYHAPGVPDTTYFQYNSPMVSYMNPGYPPPGSYHPQMNPYMVAPQPAIQGAAVPPSPIQTNFTPSANPYDQGRRQWQSDRYATRPTSVYGTPVVEYDQPSFGAPAMSRTSSSQEARRVVVATSEHRKRDDDYYRMPPPSTIPNRRPSIRHSATTSSAREILRSEATERNDPGHADRLRRDSSEHSSRPRRPSLLSNEGRKAASYMNAHGTARISVEGPGRRRATYYGAEKAKDLETKQKEAEAYQEAVTKSTPLTADALGATRQSRRSQSGSRSRASSSRDGSDLRTRSGSAVAQSDAGSITMRINAGTVELSGDFDGRTISLIPGEDGAPAELSIGRPRPRYLDGSGSTQLEYARTVPRALEEGPSTRDRDSRADRESLRSGRSGRS